MDAGFKSLSEDFGFVATLIHMLRSFPMYTEEEITRWKVYGFHEKLRYLAWEADCKKNYNEIQKGKMK